MKSSVILLIGMLIGAEVTNIAYRPFLTTQLDTIYRLREHNKSMDVRIGGLSDRLIGADMELKERLAHEKVFRAALKQLGLTEHVAMMESKLVLGKGEEE